MIAAIPPLIWIEPGPPDFRGVDAGLAGSRRSCLANGKTGQAGIGGETRAAEPRGIGAGQEQGVKCRRRRRFPRFGGNLEQGKFDRCKAKRLRAR